MTEDVFLSLVQDAAVETLGHRLVGLSIDASLADLGVDSVGLLEMVGVIEQRLGVPFADDQIVRIVSVRDMLGLVRAGAAEAASP